MPPGEDPMPAANAAYDATNVALRRHADVLEAAILGAVVERSGVVAVLTDAHGIVTWASPAFRLLVVADGEPVGRSLFALSNGRAASLAPVLRSVLDAPGRAATADIEVGDAAVPASMRVSVENLLGDADVRGVLWCQHGDPGPERIERLSRALMNIAREVEWVGFGRRRPTAPVAPIGLLPGSEELSDRERSVATMLAQGDTVAAIASRLYVSPSTVRNYLSSMYRKLGVRDLAALRELLARGTGAASLRVVEPDERELPDLEK
jgi:DNA-binding CsgD family transcriptional regulator